MADSKTLVVPSLQEPTFWNRDTLVKYQTWSWLVGTPLFLATTAAVGAGFLAAGGLAATLLIGASGVIPLVGFIKGGFDGKARMENELRNGKQINEPTIFNKSMGVGSFVAGLLAAIPVGVIFGGTLNPAGLVALAAAEATGAIIGGFSGKARMEREYAAAQAYVAQYGNYSPNQSPALAQQMQPAYSITPEESKLLEQRLAAGKRPHADVAMDQQPAQAAAR